METLGRSNKTSVKILNELDSISGGIEDLSKERNEVLESLISSMLKTLWAYFAPSVETTPQEMKNVHGSNLNRNNTEYSNPNMSLGKAAYGTFQNVFLADDEVIDLKEILQSLFDNYIERLSTYIQSTGKTYKDHKATSLSWFYKDRGNIKQTNKAKSYSLEDYEMGDYL